MRSCKSLKVNIIKFCNSGWGKSSKSRKRSDRRVWKRRGNRRRRSEQRMSKGNRIRKWGRRRRNCTVDALPFYGRVGGI